MRPQRIALWLALILGCTTPASGRPSVVSASLPTGACVSAPGPSPTASAAPGSGWSEVSTPIAPPARSDGVMEYDTALQEVVLFGGLCGETTVLGDTWIWNGGEWRNARPAVSPPPRGLAGMAYDPVRQQLVLFGGGANGTDFDDTWVWDANGWTRRETVSGPPPMQAMAMAFDPITRKVLLAGGYSALSTHGEPFEIWSWDGNRWTLEPDRLGRFGAAMATDPDGGVVVFGGQTPPLANDTVRWDGSTWATLATPIAPSKRSGARLVAAGPDALLLFGGQGESAMLRDTWLWHGRAWTALASPVSPSARSGAGMAYDAARRQVVLFGGAQLTPTSRIQLSDTWTWTP